MEIIIRYINDDETTGYVIEVPGDDNFPQGPVPGPDCRYSGRCKMMLSSIARRAYRYHAGKTLPRGAEIVIEPRR